MQLAFNIQPPATSTIDLVDGVRLLDLEPPVDDLLSEALAGLRSQPKSLPCKYFYDARGSELFEEITRLDEYYPTRTELGIMREHSASMARAVGSDALVVELGSGSGLKTKRLLRSLDRPAGLILVDISREALIASARSLAGDFPELDVLAVCADYTQSFELPMPRRIPRRVVGYFPGSTLGNFSRAEAERFLSGVARMVGKGGGLLIGVDRVKDPAVLEAAYNDARGVTAEFNKNLLDRLVAAGAAVDRRRFEHRAIYNREARRVEMHLVSNADQLVRISNQTIPISDGESICTEHSHKYDLSQLAELAKSAGFSLREHWSDAEDWFSVCHLVADNIR